MTIFEYAKKFEKDGELFYRELADRCFEIVTAVILTRLADEEVKHFKAIESMQQGENPEVAGSDILTDAKNMFDTLRAKDGLVREDIPEAEVFALGLDIEQKSREFYEKLAGDSANPAHTRIFLKLAQQEIEHYKTLEIMSNL